MALATRCPQCQSMFRVVSDQLKLRGGLVRCGSCRHVFDAIGSLSYVDEAATISMPLPPAPAPTAAATAVAATPAAAATPAVTPDSADQDAPARSDAPAARPAPRAPRAAAERKPDALAVPTLFAPDVTGSAAEAATGTEASTAADDGAAPSAPATGSEGVPADAAPAFLRKEDERRGISIVFTAGAALLALLAVVQILVVFRTELLVRWPEARPQLAALCRPFGCTVGWPTRADLLSVIGTELQAVPGTDLLELTAVIRNRAPHRVALPAVEVTLTDSQNLTVARKVFAPVDYLLSAGEPSSRIDEGLAPAGDLVVRITFEARGLNVSGFTVYHFYL